MAAAVEEVIELENLGRDVLVFPVVTYVGKDKKPKVVRRIVIGDGKDRVPHIPGARDPHLQPDPCVKLTRQDWADMGPVGQRVFRHYVDSGAIRIIRGSELMAA